MPREKVLNHLAFFAADRLTRQPPRAGSHWGCKMLDPLALKETLYAASLEDRTLNQRLPGRGGEQTAVHEVAIMTR